MRDTPVPRAARQSIVAAAPGSDDTPTGSDPAPTIARAESARGVRGALGNLHAPRYTAIWVATALLRVFSPVVAANSLSGSALLSMLAFAGLLSIAAIGQTL